MCWVRGGISWYFMCQSEASLTANQGEPKGLRLSHEKNSMPILTLPLIQEGQLSVTGERMDTNSW